MHRDRKFLRQCGKNATLCRSVELRHDETREWQNLFECFDLSDRVLSCRCVKNEQGGVRCGCIELAEHTNDFFQLGHEPSLVLQPARSIDDEDISRLRSGRL